MTPRTPKTNHPRVTDTVIAEVRGVKEALLKRYNYDLAAMVRDARVRQSQSDHLVVTKRS